MLINLLATAGGSPTFASSIAGATIGSRCLKSPVTRDAPSLQSVNAGCATEIEHHQIAASAEPSPQIMTCGDS
jgi:hypothetical protein